MRFRIFQSMEVGDPGAPTPHAAELVVEAHREELDLATIPVLPMEAHLVLDALAELVQEAVLLLPQKQDPATQTHAQGAAPTPMTGPAAPPPTPAAKAKEIATETATAVATWSVAPTTATRDPPD